MLQQLFIILPILGAHCFGPQLGLGFFGRRLTGTNLGVSLEIFIMSILVNTCGTTTWISTLTKGFIPCHGTFSGTGNRLATWNCLLGCFSGEEFFENHSVTVSFFGSWSVVRETIGSTGKHLIRNFTFCNFLEMVDPAISNTITELFFLSPQNLFWQVRIFGSVKGGSHSPLFNSPIRLGDSRSRTNHLFVGVQVHGNLQKVSIQERNSGFNSPSTHGFVAT
mmetsp:Transcript_17232/g.49000  ORF Transcript_17232/g.49000 Transcript_17232/m.49000 type:complete len:222 (+) Transcript_17232:136-801(+)